MLLAQTAIDNTANGHIGNLVHGGYGCAVGGDAAPAGALVLVAAALTILARRRRVL
ncbi:MAG: MYXO-CTERM sorting domain-containing protein [Polyangia bacterium]